MWFIGVELEQETSAPPPKKNRGSAPVLGGLTSEGDYNVPAVYCIPLLEDVRSVADPMNENK